MIQNQELFVQQQVKDSQFHPEKSKQLSVSISCPYKMLTDHWLTISRPQYKRTCGISSLISIWNYQFSKLGLGTKQPISIEQAMLKLNLIGNGSVQESFRKRFKKTAELTQKNLAINGKQQAEEEQSQQSISDKNLQQYIDNVDFGVFTGNQALMKWYRLLCRIYGGSGRSYIYYKTNSQRSSAKRAIVEDLNSKGKTCFIYHAYDHYFCPVGYEFNSSKGQNDEGYFQSRDITLQDNLCILVGESSKMFPCVHSFNWADIQLDLTTYWPRRYNIRRPKEGVTVLKTKQGSQPHNVTINCIMAFQKLKD